MKFLKYLLFLLLVLAIGFAIYIAVQPNEFSVTRTRNIQAPAAVVYDNVSDFKNWEAWSSWVEEKPFTEITLSEKTKGVGGSYAWKDDDGTGTMKTIEANPPTSLTQEMQFGEFPKSDVKWNFKPDSEGGTDVTWNISGKDLPFMFKFFSTLMGGMETQIGPHFERGLEKLDSIVVSGMKEYSISINGITQHSGGYYLYNTTSCKISDYQAKMEEMFPKVSNYAKEKNITLAGPAFQIVHKYDEENNAMIFSCAVPTTERIISDNPEILTGRLQPFKALKSTLKGNYTNLSEAWQTTMKYATDNNLTVLESGPMLESYPTEPAKFPNPADWITEIYVAIE